MRSKRHLWNWPKYGLLIVFPVVGISFSMLLSSCQPKERRVGVDYINVKDGWIPEKFNFSSVSKGDWILEVWTDAGAYAKNERIGISLRLMHKGKNPTEEPKASVHLQIEQIQGGQARRETRQEVSFKREAKTAQAWQAKIENSFPREESDKPGFATVPEGEHLINVDVHLKDGTELKAEGLLINCFWGPRFGK